MLWDTQVQMFVIADEYMRLHCPQVLGSSPTVSTQEDFECHDRRVTKVQRSVI